MRDKSAELAAGAPFAGEHKVVIIAANRAYHEAQNALLKLFEEPPPGTFIFFSYSRPSAAFSPRCVPASKS